VALVVPVMQHATVADCTPVMVTKLGNALPSDVMVDWHWNEADAETGQQYITDIRY